MNGTIFNLLIILLNKKKNHKRYWLFKESRRFSELSVNGIMMYRDMRYQTEFREWDFVDAY